MVRLSEGTGPDGYQHKLLLSLSHQVAGGSQDVPSPLPRKRRGVGAGAQSLQNTVVVLLEVRLVETRDFTPTPGPTVSTPEETTHTPSTAELEHCYNTRSILI